MDIYSITVQDLPPSLKGKVTVVPDLDALYRAVAADFADLLEQKEKKGEMLNMITPVGPLDYHYFVAEVKRRLLQPVCDRYGCLVVRSTPKYEG